MVVNEPFYRCRAINRKGRRCALEARIGTGLCGQHTLLEAHGRRVLRVTSQTLFPVPPGLWP